MKIIKNYHYLYDIKIILKKKKRIDDIKYFKININNY